MMKRILTLVLALTMLLAVLPGAQAEEPRYGGTLRFGYTNGLAAPGYTPMLTANAYLYYLTTAYENLITRRTPAGDRIFR